jgi:hypothetical protein
MDILNLFFVILEVIMKTCNITRNFVECLFYQVARNFFNSINEIIAILEVRECNLFLSWPKEQERAVHELSPVHIIVFSAQHKINLPQNFGRYYEVQA